MSGFSDGDRALVKTLRRASDTTEILGRLSRLDADARARWGRMSAHQMVCHLSDSMHVMSGERLVSDRSSPMHRTVVKWAALYLPYRWPPDIPTTPEVDQEAGGTRPVEFTSDLARLKAQVEHAVGERNSFAGRRHPIFGSLSHGQWLRWAYLHADHHLRQFGL